MIPLDVQEHTSRIFIKSVSYAWTLTGTEITNDCYPSWYCGWINGFDIIDHDLLYVLKGEEFSMRFKSSEDCLMDSTDYVPGSLAIKGGWAAIGRDVPASGNSYFMNKSGVIIQLHHEYCRSFEYQMSEGLISRWRSLGSFLKTVKQRLS
jgi:hypothetical protein